MTCLACGSVGAVSGFAVSAMLPRKREKSEGWSGILSEMARILVELRWQSGYMGIFDWKDMEEDCVVSNEYMMAPSAIHIERSTPQPPVLASVSQFSAPLRSSNDMGLELRYQRRTSINCMSHSTRDALALRKEL
jgi:hypothetical protein